MVKDKLKNIYIPLAKHLQQCTFGRDLRTFNKKPASCQGIAMLLYSPYD